ncbi:hypothetical protein C0J52_08903 [Blattella germanica]|nr:hypothetical protein C0J52_08903 [Blattella germanica]
MLLADTSVKGKNIIFKIFYIEFANLSWILVSPRAAEGDSLLVLTAKGDLFVSRRRRGNFGRFHEKYFEHNDLHCKDEIMISDLFIVILRLSLVIHINGTCCSISRDNSIEIMDILVMIQDDMIKENGRGLPVPPIIQLLVSLRYYATVFRVDSHEVRHQAISKRKH